MTSAASAPAVSRLASEPSFDDVTAQPPSSPPPLEPPPLEPASVVAPELPLLPELPLDPASTGGAAHVPCVPSFDEQS